MGYFLPRQRRISTGTRRSGREGLSLAAKSPTFKRPKVNVSPVAEDYHSCPATEADGLNVRGQSRGFDLVAELIETQRLQILLGGRDVFVTEHDLQASDIDRLEDIRGEGVAELVQVPVCAAR